MPSFVLMGSGEYLPWAAEPDRWGLDAAGVDSDRVILSPLAAAPEGDDVFENWARMGVEHFESLGMRPEVLDVRTRADAEDAAVAKTVAGARYVFFSGGNPGFLASALAGTRLWRAVLEAVAGGTTLGGCSAGMVALGVVAPDTARFDPQGGGSPWTDGLGLFSKGFLHAHWDALEGWMPGVTKRILAAWPAGSVLFALDEDTAAVGDGAHWRITGAGTLSIPGADGLEPVATGAEVAVDLGLRL